MAGMRGGLSTRMGAALRHAGWHLTQQSATKRLVLVMEKGHKEALQVEFPRCAARVFLLSEMVGKDFEIADPMGRSTADFEKTAAELEDILARGLGTIARLSEEYDA